MTLQSYSTIHYSFVADLHLYSPTLTQYCCMLLLSRYLLLIIINNLNSICCLWGELWSSIPVFSEEVPPDWLDWSEVKIILFLPLKLLSMIFYLSLVNRYILLIFFLNYHVDLLRSTQPFDAKQPHPNILCPFLKKGIISLSAWFFFINHCQCFPYWLLQIPLDSLSSVVIIAKSNGISSLRLIINNLALLALMSVCCNFVHSCNLSRSR